MVVLPISSPGAAADPLLLLWLPPLPPLLRALWVGLLLATPKLPLLLKVLLGAPAGGGGVRGGVKGGAREGDEYIAVSAVP